MTGPSNISGKQLGLWVSIRMPCPFLPLEGCLLRRIEPHGKLYDVYRPCSFQPDLLQMPGVVPFIF